MNKKDDLNKERDFLFKKLLERFDINVTVSSHKYLSEDFIRDYVDILYPKSILERQKLSETFISEV